MKLSTIAVVFVAVISIAFCYQETTYFIEISCAVAITMRRREGISVTHRVILLLLRLAMRIAFVRHHSHCQDTKGNPCLCCHFRSFVEHDPIVLHYRRIFHVFDFSILPEAKKGPDGNSLEVYVRVFLVMVEEGIKSSEELRRFLLKHPALVVFLGFKLKGVSPALPFGFDIEETVPCARHLRRKLQETQNSHLKLLLYDTIHNLQKLELLNGIAAMDTKEILACVKENNPKQYVKDRFSKDNIPPGDKTCALGAKPSSNKDSNGKKKPRYFWGYKSGAIFSQTEYGLACLSEDTSPAAKADVKFFFPLLLPLVLLGIDVKVFLADAAFDAWYVYAAIDALDAKAYIPINTRGHDTQNMEFGPNGRPVCQKGLEMDNGGKWFDKQKGYHRLKATCPLVNPRTGKRKKKHANINCQILDSKPKGCSRVINLDDPDNLRFAIDRKSREFKGVYKQRTQAERGFSIFKAYGMETPIQRNINSVANLSTLAYCLMNAKVIMKAANQHLALEDSMANSIPSQPQLIPMLS
jgi:hypothetical protein